MMALQKDVVLAQLKKVFPDGTIYKEMYTIRRVGAAIHVSVHALAKEVGQTTAQWLQTNGFTWRETGYVEPDMRQMKTEWRTDSAVNLADCIMRRFPLIGEAEISDTEYNMLFSTASGVFRKMCREGARLTRGEELVLTVATVELLKKRTSDEEDETGDISFWNYIYQQYGFNPENSDVAEQRVYKGFRDAVKNSLNLYHRFFAPENTMRYYTSLLLHAIAPVGSIESLFDILFTYYTDNLDFQYVPEDTGYKVLVRGMQARWTDKNADIQLKSSAVMSGLKTLFLERPGFMAVLCDDLVKKMDGLIRGESVDLEGRWGRLLEGWYRKKSSTERSHLQGEKRAHRTEFVATSSERIYVQYVMENEQVGLVVPRIRLQDIGDRRPVFSIYQGTREIFQTEMSVTGNDLGLTTRRVFVPLQETSFDFSRPIEISAEIEYQDEALYSSGTKLFRRQLSFDAAGNERGIRSGTAYLFTDESRNVDFTDEDAVTMEEHPGQLYRINLDMVGAVTIDGEEIFADEKQSGKPRLYPTIRPIRGITLCAEGKNYQIFQKPFLLHLHLPEGENDLRYQLLIDGQRIHAASEEGTKDYPVNEEVGCPHIVRLVDLTQTVVVLEYPYVILPDFSWSLDKERYLETEDTAQLIIRISGKMETLAAYRIPETTEAVSQADAKGHTYEVELPTVSCSFGNQSAFRLTDHLWHREIGKDIFSVLKLPDGWQGQLMLNAYALKANAEGQYELGNLVHSGRSFQASETLWLSLVPPEGEAEHIPLSQIHFSPGFIEEPLAFRVNELQWLPRGNYIGDEGARFRLEMEGAQNLHFDGLGTYDKLLCRAHDLSHGRYRYCVYMQKTGLFAGRGEQMVFSGEIIVGDENEFRFDGKELHLTNAIYWDVSQDELMQMEMRPGTAILEKLRYIGSEAPEWETIPLPEYEAVLKFETGSGRRIPFNADPGKEEFICTNPVRVWIVNEHRLIMATVDEEVVYFDTATASIPNRDPERTMNKAALRARLKNPDYFEYETRGERYV